MRFVSALVIFAHPDDAEYMCGGTVAAWAQDGTEVRYCVITDGSAGSNEPGVVREELAVVREAEQRAAAEILGVKDLTFLGFRDGELEVNLETRRAVTRVVRRVRPDVIVAPDPAVSGPAAATSTTGIQAGGHARALCGHARCPSPAVPELLDEGLEPFEVPNLWLGSEDADIHVDITSTIDTKLAALAAHQSQHAEASAPWVRERARQVGEGAGVEYAEAFKTFAFEDDEE